jgi:2-enoate reductase
MMKLMEPGEIGGTTLKNRVIMTPMGMFGIPAADGSLTPTGIDFYLERAKGGAALVFPAAALVTTEFESTCVALNAFDSMDKAVAWSRLAEQVHHYGCKLGIQLSAGLGRTSVSYFFDPAFVPVSASPVNAHWTPWLTCRALEVEEIQSIVTAFTMAAMLVPGCGIDVIEIHGYGGYLLDQFMSTLWNKRTDAYGGDLDGRMRFALEVVGAVKAACGDVPVIFKMTPVHHTAGGRELGEGIEIARMLEGAGVDAIHADAGCYEAWHKAIPPVYEPPAAQIEMAAAIKSAVGIPVIANGKLGDPEVAEAVLLQGKADFIGLGRSHLADPEWANKVKEGRPEDIVPCIGCGEGCMARGFSGKYASCAVNPSCAMEGRFPLEPAMAERRLLVVGGGPAGMMAAVTAARRGIDVELWESSERLGGHLVAAGAPEFKRDVRRLLDHLVGQVEKLGVNVKLGKRATAGEIAALEPDAVIAATGAAPVVPERLRADNVKSAVDVLTGDLPEGKRVVVAGAGVVGCETAMFLAGLGKRVTIVDQEGILVSEPVFILNKASLLEKMISLGIETMAGAELVDVEKGRANIKTGGVASSIECDAVVLALGFAPDGRVAGELSSLDGVEVKMIGDAVAPRKILNAIWEGFHTARLFFNKGGEP